MLLSEVPTIVAVASGKGGVGKTFLAVELARTIDERGGEVGLLDLDLTTPDSDKVVARDDTIEHRHPQQPPPGDTGGLDTSGMPVEVEGIQLVGKGPELPDFAVNTNDERMQLETMLRYVRETHWDDATTHVVVDTPPGTGSELQTVLRDVEPDLGLVVTTGTANAVRDAARTHELFRRVGLEHAVVVNMRRTRPSIDEAALRRRLADVDTLDEAAVPAVVSAVEDALAGQDVPLHDDGIDVSRHISAPLVADVPFSNDRDRVREALETALHRTGIAETLEG
jgi:MinD-like ATPase involved in chromosome partitioning or flagellar assembly